MPEIKSSVGRTGSYLSHSAYRKIKRVLSFRRRVFGQRLEETVLYERRYGVHMAPLVVEQCVDFIRERGLLEVGLFRQPGQATLVRELQEAFDAGEKPSFDSTDVHTVASLLKLYLRELPEPLVPFSRYQDFLLCGKKLSSERTQGLVELRCLLHELPVANFNLLHYICQFLNEVQTFSCSNKMSTQNLATVFGPNILRPKAEDPESIIGGAAVVQQLMLELIREHQCLFSKEGGASGTPPGPSRPDSYPCRRRGTGESWPPQPCPATHQQRAPRSSPCSRQLSLPLIAERRGSGLSPMFPFPSNADPPHCEALSPVSPAGALCHRYPPSHPDYHPQPGHPASTLPTSASTVTLQADLEPAPGPSRNTRLGSGGWPGLEGPHWGAERANEGGLAGNTSGSSETQEDSTLSVYDNLDIRSVELKGEVGERGEDHAGGLAVTKQEVEPEPEADSTSSWSSCEGLPLDGGGAVGAEGGAIPEQRPARFTSFRSHTEEDDEDPHPNSPASSSVPTDPLLSTGSSEVFLPSGPLEPLAPAPHVQAIHCLLAGLRQQMARQRAEYETKIQRLEQRNEALQGEMAVLRANLTQQRRWHSVAEIKIRNVERARSDADRRNATLQREMEQFFETFGDLSAEARKAERIVQSF
ncbi:rho GTPase-activating protein 24 isoform X2 [Hypomesus transpacificus]|uniref:rho GTPase-activating protein 24 isoform X2 n=1 Tax=Hypomesus transpacificus TaxID=137520 RepID=UPI001F074E05|nr:rho GTPase-activating protein 24 isoform X2 [Hypomesus transpacificus]